MTNGDKIRSMPDEELWDLFHDIYNAGTDDSTEYEWGTNKDSFIWDMEWLESEVSEYDKWR